MTKKNNFSTHDYEIIQKDLLYQGVFKLVRLHVRHRLFNSEAWSEVFTREILERKSAVAVLPYDPILDKVLLIEQFRAGALSNPSGPWLFEIVAGLYNNNETLQDVATRESQEEAGCHLLDLHPIAEYFVSPGGSNEYISLFIGRIDAQEAGGIFGLPEEHENIRVSAFSLPDAFTLLRAGKIKTSPAIICLQWLQLNQNWLKQLWQIK